jgi:hypothetical protein
MFSHVSDRGKVHLIYYRHRECNSPQKLGSTPLRAVNVRGLLRPPWADYHELSDCRFSSVTSLVWPVNSVSELWSKLPSLVGCKSFEWKLLSYYKTIPSKLNAQNYMEKASVHLASFSLVDRFSRIAATRVGNQFPPLKPITTLMKSDILCT